MNSLRGHAHKDAGICLHIDWFSGMPSSDRERSSEVEASCCEWWRGCGSADRKQSHLLLSGSADRKHSHLLLSGSADRKQSHLLLSGSAICSLTLWAPSAEALQEASKARYVEGVTDNCHKGGNSCVKVLPVG